MLSTGIGDQMAQALDSIHESDHEVRLSSLKTQGMLGAGAFGKVIKVLDARTAEVYAMKLQKRNMTTKFAVREAQAMEYSHAFIVRIVHIFQTRTFYGILMECCERNLNKCILDYADSSGYAHGLPDAKTARYTACVALALDSLHGRRIVFRDLKPENILVSSHEKDGSPPYQLDAGPMEPIATDFPKASPVSGTLSFMPEEVWREAELEEEDESTDVRKTRLEARDWYALGCCMVARLVLLGERGNRRITSDGRDVLLPPPTRQELWVTLRGAARECSIDEDAFMLVSSLTAAWQERGRMEDVRRSPFMEAAMREMAEIANEGEEHARRQEEMAMFGTLPTATAGGESAATALDAPPLGFDFS
ncbi:unnamed protein product [Prorocentrum cordatum]|uniref:Protein kinase domain-containing protein n=1 Tax=Prorocentrum cordatum TaxID=2364126 RepID=A0ABN9UE48_9DINO|nr:unnamed protein product [Polarella glacialis]